MDQILPSTVSPHRVFSRKQWATLRADTPLTLGEEDLSRLRSLNDPLSLGEAARLYLPTLLAFLNDIKAGKRNVVAPVYSHLVYDIVPGEKVIVERPDILIVEGLNVLQTSRLPRDGRAVPFVSDFFDFKVYLDADEA